MHKHLITLLILIAFLFGVAAAKPLEQAIYTDEYALSLYPEYPATIGEATTIRLRTFYPAEKVTLISDRFQKIKMTYRDGHWWGKFEIPDDYKDGWHFFTVWTRQMNFSANVVQPKWSESVVWYRAYSPAAKYFMKYGVAGKMGKEKEQAEEQAQEQEEEKEEEKEEEQAQVSSAEATPLVIKGSQSITFKTRTLSGSKEGYSPGTLQTREETLRLNITGTASDVEIEANVFRTSAIGLTQLGERDEKISILMKHGSTEVYLGDFTANFGAGEFVTLQKVLSGARVKGDYSNWGFSSLYSSPKGEAKFTKMYGDGTQGPYSLGNSPVVIDSEQVLLDGIRLYRSEDYTIDYQAGTITFLKAVVDAKSVINVYYDYRQTVYAHSTYGLRSYLKPNDNLSIGATYINDSDQLSGAAEIRSSMSAEAFDPQSHYVVGTDVAYKTQNLSGNFEAAYSFNDLNLLSPGTSVRSGRAARLEFDTSQGPIGLAGRVKRVGLNFTPLDDPSPKQDVYEYYGELRYRPSSIFASRADYFYGKYQQNGVLFENLSKKAKAQIIPEDLPSLEYQFSEAAESNDPVSGSQIERKITKNSLELVRQAGIFSASLKGATERWLRRSPSEEVTDYRKVSAGLATIGLEKISFSSNVEIEKRVEPDASEPFRKTYNLKLAATPSTSYQLSSSVQIIDDSIEGHTNVTDLSYLAKPSKAFQTDGKYTVSSVVEDFSGTGEAVSKQSGSFSLDLRPRPELRLRYQYKPNFTRILRTQTISYNNEQQQMDLNLIPVKYALFGLIVKKGSSYTIDK
ncbi:MAG: hypothetical protein KJ811_00085, partial [Candidatus Margulisbacteria bacterium]|nr:hypothetical protein [Candidatus Margulisiibacteriota bacterium]